MTDQPQTEQQLRNEINQLEQLNRDHQRALERIEGINVILTKAVKLIASDNKDKIIACDALESIEALKKERMW